MIRVGWMICTAAIIVCWPAIAAERRLTIEGVPGPVGRFQKAEFTLRADVVGDNPYDPEEIDFRLEVTLPSGGRVWTPAFYDQPYEHRPLTRRENGGEWMYPAGPAAWKVRFAPTELGRHVCAAVLKDRAGTARSEPLSFECVASDDRGFVRVSRRDARYMEFDNGSPFFAVGQNVAFVTNATRTAEMIRRLGENGANFARVWACAEDWAMAIESRKSAFGRSWAWNPPFVSLPEQEGYHSDRLCIRLSGEAGAVLELQPCHGIPLRPNTKYRLAGKTRGGELTVALDRGAARPIPARKQWAPFSEEFTSGADQWWMSGPVFRLTSKGAVLLRDLSLTEAGGGPELLWEADPNRPLLGAYNQPDCDMLDRVVEAAERSGIYLQVVLFTRDHYMAMLARENGRSYEQAIAHGRRLVRYAAARWGYSTHIAAWEYFNEMNPGLPTDRFYTELGNALDEADVNRHLRANSTWSSPSKDYRHPGLDTADLHYYIRPSTGHLYRDEVASVLSRWEMMRKNVSGRPIIFAEFGITDDRWQRARELDNDKDFVHLHNALWASAMTGFASTVCHWYWDDVQRRDLYHNYRGISAFAAQVPWTSGRLRQAVAACDKGLRTVGLAGDNGVYLWISDPGATWWPVAMEGRLPQPIEGAVMQVELPAGAYQIEWWDTRKGEVTARQQVQSAEGRVSVAVPRFAGDVACRIIRLGV